MGIVTVQGRDEFGRIIDVTMTTEADVPPPGPEVLATGGGSAAILTGTETVQRTIYVGDEDPEVDHLADLIDGDIWRNTTGGPPYSTLERQSGGWTAVPLVVKSPTGDIQSIVDVGDGTNVAMWVYDQTDPEIIRAQINLVADGTINIGTADALGVTDVSISLGLGAIFVGVGLPTADPLVAGQLWNDTGIVKVSAG